MASTKKPGKKSARYERVVMDLKAEGKATNPFALAHYIVNKSPKAGTARKEK